jgi:hypothetical protein
MGAKNTKKEADMNERIKELWAQAIEAKLREKNK